MGRFTDEQLAEILGRKGYAIAPGSIPIKDSGSSPLPVAQCGAGDGPLAKAQGKEAGARRLLVRVKVYRKIPTDFDNQFIKWHLDCLRYCGAIPDDRQQDIRLEVAEQVKVKTDAEERVELEVFADDPLETKQENKKEANQ